MANESVGDAYKYVPNRTLGRSGYVPSVSDGMHERVNQLDALLCVLTTGPDGEEGFLNLNNDIQYAVLCLASRLATEINEAQEELMMERIRKSAADSQQLT